MKPIWIIEKNVFQDGTDDRMADIARASGMEVLRIEYEWQHGVKGRFIRANECVAFYGSMNTARRLLRHHQWSPTAWFNLETLQCTSYYAHWGEFLFQQEYMLLPWAEMKRKKEFLYNTLWNGHAYSAKKIFLRPNSNTKLFTGTVLEWDKFEHFIDMTDECYTPDPETLVVAAKAQFIANEWRFVVSEGKVLTGSWYGKDGGGNALSNNIDGSDSPQDMKARELAETIAKYEWQPDIIYTMDICDTTSGQTSLLEIGSVNTAAVYGCNLDVVVQKVSELAERVHAEAI